MSEKKWNGTLKFHHHATDFFTQHSQLFKCSTSVQNFWCVENAVSSPPPPPPPKKEKNQAKTGALPKNQLKLRKDIS